VDGVSVSKGHRENVVCVVQCPDSEALLGAPKPPASAHANLPRASRDRSAVANQKAEWPRCKIWPPNIAGRIVL
jgi:hypothetical protein